MAKNVQLSNTVTIASAGTTSTTLNLAQQQRIPLAIVTPAALTATSFTFLVSSDDVTYNQLYYEGTAVSITVAASRYIALDRDKFDSVKYLKIVAATFSSGSSEAATRTIGVIIGD